MRSITDLSYSSLVFKHLLPLIFCWFSISSANLTRDPASSTPSLLNLSPTTVWVMAGSGKTPSGFGVEWFLYQRDTWLVTILKNCLWAPWGKAKLSWGVLTLSKEIQVHHVHHLPVSQPVQLASLQLKPWPWQSFSHVLNISKTSKKIYKCTNDWFSSYPPIAAGSTLQFHALQEEGREEAR